VPRRGFAAQLVADEVDVADRPSDGTGISAHHGDQKTEDDEQPSSDDEDPPPYGFSSAVLESVDTFIQASPLPWKSRTLLPRLMKFMPEHDPIMLGTAVMCYLRGAKTSAIIIMRNSASRAPVRCEGNYVLPLDGRSIALFCVSGIDTPDSAS